MSDVKISQLYDIDDTPIFPPSTAEAIQREDGSETVEDSIKKINENLTKLSQVETIVDNYSELGLLVQKQGNLIIAFFGGTFSSETNIKTLGLDEKYLPTHLVFNVANNYTDYKPCRIGLTSDGRLVFNNLNGGSQTAITNKIVYGTLFWFV